MTKVLFYIAGTIIGGAETQLLTLVRSLDRSKYDLKVATNERNHTHPFWADLKKEVSLTPCASVQELAGVIRTFSPDVVQHFHNTWVSAAMDLADYRGAGVEVVHGRVHFPNDVTTTPKHHTSHVVAVSADAANFFLASHPEWRAKVSVIANGIDTKRFAPDPSPLPKSPLRILHVGRLCEGDKNYVKMMEVCAKLPQKNWELWFAGTGADFELIHDYAAYNVPGHVKFFGFCEQPEMLYHNAHIYMSRSPTEGFGLSVAEAAACGMPINLWDCGGVASYFTSGQNALVTNNEDEFAANLRLLLNNAELRQKFGAGARELAVAEFSADAMAKQYDHLYQRLCGDNAVVVRPRRQRRVIGMSNPNFVGVTTATNTWVGQGNTIAATAATEIRDIKAAIAQRNPEILVLGGDSNYLPAVQQLKRDFPTLKIMLTWHSTFGFNSFAPADGDLLARWIKALHMGAIDRIGFVKPGMAAALRDPRAVWFPNRVPAVAKVPPVALGEGFHIGVFGTGFAWKNMYQMVIGASLVPNAVIHVNKLENQNLTRALGIQVVEHDHMPRHKFHALLSAMDVNVQGGFTESFGLTFCESYLLGVPCATTAAVQPVGFAHAQIPDQDDPESVAQTIVMLKDDPKVEQVKRLLAICDGVAERQINKVLEDM